VHPFDIKKNSFVLIIFFSLLFSGCSVAKVPDGQKKFGPDADYFIGLQLLAKKNEKDARVKFNQCLKKGTRYCRQKSAEALTTFGDSQERNQAVLYLVENFPNSDSLLTAAKQLYQTNEIHKLIDLTKNCDLSTEYNETIKIRLEAMQKRGDSAFNDEVFKWFTTRSLTDTHYKFYRDVLIHPDFEEEDATYTPEDFILYYRVKLYRRDYTYCFQHSQEILDYIEEKLSLDSKLEPTLQQLASDLGKAYLYASQDFAKNGYIFRLLAEKYKDTSLEYYFWFYSGRFYDKGQTYYTQTKKCFSSAVEAANNPQQKDNALWYLLDSSLNFGINSISETISTCSKEFSNPVYFDDFFEKLISALLASGKWNTFYDIYTQIDGYASNEVVAQMSYIYGRLLQEGNAQPPEDKEKDTLITEAFTRALNCGSAVYYKILAMYQLNYDEAQIQEQLCKRYTTYKTKGTDPTGTKGTDPSEASFQIDKEADLLLSGYSFFGFPDLIYENYMDLYKNGISTDTSMALAQFLQKCGPDNHDFYTQSLRIAARAINYGDRDFTREELKYLYPQDYFEYVDTYSTKFNCDKSVMYALIRSESFFDADVTSSAGAVGLCQLMEFTGADIAQRLRKQDYSLTDPETNIEFGCYYLNNLYTRCDNSYLQAFFAYNAGITRVRRWLQSSLIEFGKKKNMPEDLFLEAIPYSETREYGRKLVSASVIYDWLYNNNFRGSILCTIL